MHTTINEITNLFSRYIPDPILSIDKLPQAGSDRQYFRLHTAAKNYIGTHGSNVQENETFIYFSEQFATKNLPTARVLFVSDDRHCYIQEDFGNECLLDKLEQQGFTTYVYELYKQSLSRLALLQIKAHEVINYNKCLTNAVFGGPAIMADLLYFKYYFVDALGWPYDKQKLIDDFEALGNYLSHTEYKFFMFRDFQSRNIMVSPAVDGQGELVHFIDYQGGMNGAPQYDVASLLWQAKANLPDEWKRHLLNDYMDSFEAVSGKPMDRDLFQSQYHGYVLIRLLQVLGAYGFRGLFERKAHFLTSIPLALQNLRWFLQHESIAIAVPEFKKVLSHCISDEVLQRFTPLQASDTTPLVVDIKSFSFIRMGYPKDETKNGGGFVFDMRGILNPGRFEEYKHLTGNDKKVQDFLEQQTKMPEFLNGVYSTVDIAVEDYIRRGFEHLTINFGCTGGQHRSVYAAEALARHLRNKFKVTVKLSHTNEANWLQ